MPAFYLDKLKSNDGRRELHREDCPRLPERSIRLYLGEYDSCQRALLEAERHYRNCRGCRHCANECCYDLDYGKS